MHGIVGNIETKQFIHLQGVLGINPIIGGCPLSIRGYTINMHKLILSWLHHNYYSALIHTVLYNYSAVKQTSQGAKECQSVF